MVNLMIAEDEIDIGLNYFHFLTNDKDIKIVSFTTDGERTLKDYLEKKPDILLLDLDMPKMSGLEIIDYLNQIPEERNKCNIIVITGDRLKMSKLRKTSKVYQIVEKPIDSERLLALVKEVPIPETNDFEMKKQALFQDLHLKPYYEGTEYLSDAVDVVHNKRTERLEDIYKIVSAKRKVSPSRVKWGIRNTVKRMNRVAPKECLKNIFYVYNSSEKVTPKDFMTYTIKYLNKAI